MLKEKCSYSFRKFLLKLKSHRCFDVYVSCFEVALNKPPTAYSKSAAKLQKKFHPCKPFHKKK